MKKFGMYKLVKNYPILIGFILIATLLGGLLVQRCFSQKQETQVTIVPDDLARTGTIEQFQNPENLIKYTVEALKKQDMDLVLRACAIDENLLGNPFYSTLEKEEKFGYDMMLPPSADYEEYRPLSSMMLTKYYTEQYDKIQKQFKELGDIKLEKVGVLYPEIQLDTKIPSETADLCSEWGADETIQMGALLQDDQENYMISFTVTKYYGYWKIFDFTAELAEVKAGQIIKPISLDEYDNTIGEMDVLSFTNKLNSKISDGDVASQVAEDIKHPEKEILPSNYFIIGTSYAKEQKDLIQKFILALQKKNITEALSYCNMSNPEKKKNIVTSEAINVQEDYAKQLYYFYYGLLGEPYFSGEKTLERLGETAGELLNKLNPQMLPFMSCTKILKVADDRAGEKEQYIALYRFNGNYYKSGYTLVKLEGGWQIASLSALENGLEAGEVKEISWGTYQRWMDKD
ncbi:MAG TPA: hypothetical protein DIW07_07510 [Lachnospiraceae bacterium]|jgi:hypothetical protein|uniref:hypothetical protein n=1 Tax=Muricomes intestini TaxID=1796634 RepID=UPI000E940F0B|nr:hypothetical protein [Lachnospiraceae bacterium]HCR83247.1 hypothetical protein [Lachnospiraceae bacterium]